MKLNMYHVKHLTLEFIRKVTKGMTCLKLRILYCGFYILFDI